LPIVAEGVLLSKPFLAEKVASAFQDWGIPKKCFFSVRIAQTTLRVS